MFVKSINRSAFLLYFTLISAKSLESKYLDEILETPLPTSWVLGMSNLILFVKIVGRAESTFVDEMLVWGKSSAGLSRTFHV